MADYGGYGPDWVVSPADGWTAPKGRTPDGRVLADGGRRVLGFLVDLAIWTVPQVILITVAIVVLVASIPSDSSSEDPSTGGILAFLGIYALIFLVGILRLAVEAEKVARTGQTWGMKALDLRVVDGRTGGPVTRGRAWGRAAFGSFLSSQLFGFGYWWAFFDDRNRTLHDLVCATVVIDER
jgi:uncharacterized RDD family membrane protein YckC